MGFFYRQKALVCQSRCGFGRIFALTRWRPHFAKKFEKAALSLFRFSVLSNASRKQSFSKTLFKQDEFENVGFSFKCEQKTF